MISCGSCTLVSVRAIAPSATNPLPPNLGTRSSPASCRFRTAPSTPFCAPVIREQKGEHRDLFTELLKRGFVRVRVDGEIVSLNSEIHLDRTRRHNVEVVVDRLTSSNAIRSRLGEAVETALKMGKGTLIVAAEADDKPPIPSEETDNHHDILQIQNKTKAKKTRVGRSSLLVVLRLFRLWNQLYSTDAADVQFQQPAGNV